MEPCFFSFFFFKSNRFSTFLESFLLKIVGTGHWITSKQPSYFVCSTNEIPVDCQTDLLSALSVQDLLSQSLVSIAQADTSTAPLQKAALQAACFLVESLKEGT